MALVATEEPGVARDIDSRALIITSAPELRKHRSSRETAKRIQSHQSANIKKMDEIEERLDRTEKLLGNLIDHLVTLVAKNDSVTELRKLNA